MKRIMTALIMLLMAAVVFVGCKKQAEQAPTLTSSGKLVVEMFDRGTDGGRTLAYDNAWTNWIKDKVKKDLNIDVTFQAVGRWSENTDIVNLMASRSAPDLCYSYNGGMIDNFRDWGGILNLTPYIDSYLPDLKKLLGEDPVFKTMALMEVAISWRALFAAMILVWDFIPNLALPIPTSTFSGASLLAFATLVGIPLEAGGLEAQPKRISAAYNDKITTKNFFIKHSLKYY
jgi:hypothetical protein